MRINPPIFIWACLLECDLPPPNSANSHKFQVNRVWGVELESVGPMHVLLLLI